MKDAWGDPSRDFALCACVVALAPRAAGAQEEEAAEPQASAIVVGGLRPASAGYATTEILRLSHAQRVREIVDGVVHEITGRTVLNHAALRAALGQRYLVELFGCEGALACVVRAFGKVKGQASHLVYGDYSVKRRKYRVRMRLIDLATGKLVSDLEFTLDGNEIETAATWKQKMKPLCK